MVGTVVLLKGWQTEVRRSCCSCPPQQREGQPGNAYTYGMAESC